MNPFDDLGPEQRLRLFAIAERRAFDPGTALVTEGSPARALLVLQEGTATVHIDHLGVPVPVNHVRSVCVLGEISYLDGGPASASVVADERCIVDVLDADALRHVLNEDHELAAGFHRVLAVTLARRLRDNTDLRLTVPFSAG